MIKYYLKVNIYIVCKKLLWIKLLRFFFNAKGGGLPLIIFNVKRGSSPTPPLGVGTAVIHLAGEMVNLTLKGVLEKSGDFIEKKSHHLVHITEHEYENIIGLFGMEKIGLGLNLVNKSYFFYE